VEDSDQLIPLAFYCWKVGLREEAKFLYEKIENLVGTNTNFVIKSLLGQAKYFGFKKDSQKVLELVKKAEKAIIPGSDTEHYRQEIYFHCGLIQEKMGKLRVALRFYKLAISVSMPGSEIHTNSYRRLTLCLQNQVKQLKKKLKHAEDLNVSMQSSKFWKLRSLWMRIKERLQGLLRSPKLPNP
jgi:tetratricopeptide (TPR) repeat protein